MVKPRTLEWELDTEKHGETGKVEFGTKFSKLVSCALHNDVFITNYPCV
jgi:hypothetical protein